jgi:predicted GTPase
MSDTIEVFISYSKQDKELRDGLLAHLRPLEGEGIITWYDRQVLPGTEWDEVIKARLNAADIILLLISADFLATDYCTQVEIPEALRRHEAGEATVMPVILRSCGWKYTDLAKIQAYPEKAKPIVSWTHIDEAYTNVVDGVYLAATKIEKQRKHRRLEEQEKLHQVNRSKQHQTVETKSLEPQKSEQRETAQSNNADDLTSEHGIDQTNTNPYTFIQNIPIRNDRNTFLVQDSPDYLAKKHSKTMSKPHYNTAIIGMTGVGKSTLVNYLFGERIAETGLGTPVTKKGFNSYEFRIGELPVRLFDSWGLEVGKVDEWMTSLNEELALRGINRPAEEWFHTILYCINAAGSRLQDTEIQIIKRFLEDKYRVIIVLTKADLLSEEEETHFSQIIRQNTDENLSVIAACCESRQSRKGIIVSPFGKEEIEASIYKNFWDTIIDRLPQRCCQIVKDFLENWKNSQIRHIQEQASKGTSIEIIQENLNKSWLDNETIRRLIEEEISQTIYVYGSISESMNLNADDYNLQLRKIATFNGTEYSIWNFDVIGPSLGAGLVAANVTGMIALGITGASTLVGAGSLAFLPLAAFIVIPVAIAIPMIRNQKQNHRNNLANSLIKAVEAEVEKFTEGIDSIERSIEKSLGRLREIASNRESQE